MLSKGTCSVAYFYTFCIHLIVSRLHSSEKFITSLTKYDKIQLKILMGT